MVCRSWRSSRLAATLSFSYDFGKRGRDALERAERHSLRPADAQAQPGIRPGGHRPDGARHRPQHGRLFCCQQCRLAVIAGSRARGARQRLSGLPRCAPTDRVRCARPVLDARIPRVPRRGAYAVGTDGVLARMDRDPGPRVPAGNRRHPRDVQLLCRARSVAGDRHGLHAGQLRHTERAPGGHVEPCVLEPRVRRGSEHSPETNRPERPRGDRRWRRTGRIRRRGHGEGGVLCAHVDGRRVAAGPEPSQRERPCELADADRSAPRRCVPHTGSDGSLDGRRVASIGNSRAARRR